MTTDAPSIDVSLAADPALAETLAFVRRFGTDHLLLAMHAAVPLGLTPELLHLIRLNFLARVVPPIAEADLLLSPLCQDLGDGLYQMSPDIRDLLLDELRTDPEYGVRRQGIRAVADLLLAFTERHLPLSRTSYERSFLMAQQWTALAYLEPRRAAEALAAELARSLLPGHRTASQDVLRVAQVAQVLTAPLLCEEQLLLYIAAVERSFTGHRATARSLFEELKVHEQKFAFRENLHLPSGIEVLAATLPTTFTNSLGMKFALVRPGTFWMSENGKNAVRFVEMPHEFYMGVYPVTQEQWQLVMGDNPSRFSRTGSGKDEVRDISDTDLEQFPVDRVSWDMAQKFLEKLNARAAREEKGWLYRLPTEAEWEYTCRGGRRFEKEGRMTLNKEHCSFHFYFEQPTNDLSSEQANFDGNYPAGKASKGPYLGRPSQVGSYPPNALGLHDLHGNVWEWCQDLVAPEGSDRVIRGGGWDEFGSNCAAANRSRGAPEDLGDNLGIRLARVPSSK